MSLNEVDPSEAQGLMKEKNNLLLLDVREQHEYDRAHIEGVKLLSHYCGVLRQPSSSLLDPPFRYPPYTASKVNLLAFVLRYPGSPLAAWLAKAGKLVRPLLVALLVLLAYRIGRRRGAAAALGLVLRTR